MTSAQRRILGVAALGYVPGLVLGYVLGRDLAGDIGLLVCVLGLVPTSVLRQAPELSDSGARLVDQVGLVGAGLGTGLALVYASEWVTYVGGIAIGVVLVAGAVVGAAPEWWRHVKSEGETVGLRVATLCFAVTAFAAAGALIASVLFGRRGGF